MKITKILLLLIAHFLLATQIAIACSCVLTTPEQNFQRADAVFVGRLVKIDDGLRLDVEKSWKLVNTNRVRVSESGRGSCRQGYSLGETYLVYAQMGKDPENVLVTEMCLGTGLLKDSGMDLGYLQNRATIPLMKVSPVANHSNNQDYVNTILQASAIILVFLVIGLIVHWIKYRAT